MPKYGHGALNVRRPYPTDILCYYLTHCDTAQIWSWWTQYTSPAHNRYPAIYVVFVCRGRKTEHFQKVTTSQEHQTINNAVLYWTQRTQPSLLSRIVMVSAKTSSAVPFCLSTGKLMTVQQKRLIYFSLDFWIVPCSRAQKLQTVHVFP